MEDKEEDKILSAGEASLLHRELELLRTYVAYLYAFIPVNFERPVLVEGPNGQLRLAIVTVTLEPVTPLDGEGAAAACARYWALFHRLDDDCWASKGNIAFTLGELFTFDEGSRLTMGTFEQVLALQSYLETGQPRKMRPFEVGVFAFLNL